MHRDGLVPVGVIRGYLRGSTRRGLPERRVMPDSQSRLRPPLNPIVITMRGRLDMSEDDKKLLIEVLKALKGVQKKLQEMLNK